MINLLFHIDGVDVGVLVDLQLLLRHLRLGVSVSHVGEVAVLEVRLIVHLVPVWNVSVPSRPRIKWTIPLKMSKCPANVAEQSSSILHRIHWDADFSFGLGSSSSYSWSLCSSSASSVQRQRIVWNILLWLVPASRFCEESFTFELYSGVSFYP